MRHLALLLTASLLLTTLRPASAALRKTSAVTARASVNAVRRPVATLKARFNEAADRVVERLLLLLPPAFQHAPDERDGSVPMNKMATASLACGIGGWLLFPLALPAAVVTGIIALNEIRDTGEGGKGRAIAGIVLGALPLAILLVAFAWANGQ